MASLFKIEEEVSAARDGDERARRVGKRIEGFGEGFGSEVILPEFHIFLNTKDTKCTKVFKSILRDLCVLRGENHFPRSPRIYGSPNAAGAPIRLRMDSREPITSTMTVNAYGSICKKKPR